MSARSCYHTYNKVVALSEWRFYMNFSSAILLVVAILYCYHAWLAMYRARALDVATVPITPLGGRGYVLFSGMVLAQLLWSAFLLWLWWPMGVASLLLGMVSLVRKINKIHRMVPHEGS